MSRLIIPNRYLSSVQLKNPLIFLAGPIRGAPNWQDRAARILFSMNPDLIVASPRIGIREEIKQFVAEGDENYFPRQRAWERHYLDVASRKGAIMFWLPGEVEHRCEKSYGAMTRIELGQWMTRKAYDNSIRICIGSDGKFSELSTIKYDLELDAPGLEVKQTLEETCEEAVKSAIERK